MEGRPPQNFGQEAAGRGCGATKGALRLPCPARRARHTLGGRRTPSPSSGRLELEGLRESSGWERWPRR